jgi:hypothetical protein
MQQIDPEDVQQQRADIVLHLCRLGLRSDVQADARIVDVNRQNPRDCAQCGAQRADVDRKGRRWDHGEHVSPKATQQTQNSRNDYPHGP